MRFKNEADLQKWLEQARNGEPKRRKCAAAPELRQIDTSLQRRIIGIDTALRCTGWGIIDVRNGKILTETKSLCIYCTEAFFYNNRKRQECQIE